MKKLLLIILLFTGLTGFRQSNTRRISGTVYDKDDGSPVPGVSVRIKGTDTSTMTNTAGNYKINVQSAADSLVFSLRTYRTQIKAIPKNNIVNVAIELL